MGWRPQMVLWYWCRYSVKATGSRCAQHNTSVQQHKRRTQPVV